MHRTFDAPRPWTGSSDHVVRKSASSHLPRRHKAALLLAMKPTAPRATALVVALACLVAAAHAQAATGRLVAALPDAALDAALNGRFVATTAGRVDRAAVAAALNQGVAAGFIAQGTDDQSNVGLGVVTFKAATAANAQAFVRANAALFSSVEAEQKFSIVQRRIKSPPPPAPLRPPPPPQSPPPPPFVPPPPALLDSDTCSTATNLWGLDVLCVPVPANRCCRALTRSLGSQRCAHRLRARQQLQLGAVLKRHSCSRVRDRHRRVRRPGRVWHACVSHIHLRDGLVVLRRHARLGRR